MKVKVNSLRGGSLLCASLVCLMGGVFLPTRAQTPAARALTSKDKMTINGIGPVQIGITLTKAIDATQVPWTVEASVEDGGCRYAKPTKPASSLAFMIIEGTVVRAEVSKPGIMTVSGIQVGDSEARVKATYPGKITVEQHKYNAKGHYLIYTPSDKKDENLRLIFETDGKVVTTYRVGRLPEVTYVEGCL